MRNERSEGRLQDLYDELLDEYKDTDASCRQLGEDLQLVHDYLAFMNLQESFEDFRQRAQKVFTDDQPFGQYVIR